MGSIKLSIHPLFFLLGIYYALTGGIFLFIICTATAVIHELGHSFASSQLGYKLNKIMLMPFGAVVSGNLDGLKFFDEVKIALAGPLINVSVALFFVATWWIYPDIYAFTDVVVSANLSMALVNLLPVYPLDGGRIVFAMLGVKLGYEKAFTISKVMGIVFALVLSLLFVVGLFNNLLNLSLLFFSVFVFFGAISREKENKYVKIFTVLDDEKLKRGVAVKVYAVHKDIKIKNLINLIDFRSVSEVEVFDNGNKIAHLSQKGIERIISSTNIYSSVAESLKILEKNS